MDGVPDAYSSRTLLCASAQDQSIRVNRSVTRNQKSREACAQGKSTEEDTAKSLCLSAGGRSDEDSQERDETVSKLVTIDETGVSVSRLEEEDDDEQERAGTVSELIEIDEYRVSLSLG